MSEYDRMKAQYDEINAKQLRKQQMSEPVYGDIRREREQHDAMHGGPEDDDNYPRDLWLMFLKAECDKAFESLDSDQYRERLVNVGAIAVAAIESYDRKKAGR